MDVKYKSECMVVYAKKWQVNAQLGPAGVEITEGLVGCDQLIAMYKG